MFTLTVILLFFLISSFTLSCSNHPVEIEPPLPIQGKYVLLEYCVSYYTKKGTNIDTQLTMEGYRLNNTGCSTASEDSFVSMSTMIITTDSIIRFGFHCPGDNSGSTRIAYGYRLNNGKLVGDSLCGEGVSGPVQILRISTIEKHHDNSLKLIQYGFYSHIQKDSTFCGVFEGKYVERDSTMFNYGDEPTCKDNYSPWFPMPFW